MEGSGKPVHGPKLRTNWKREISIAVLGGALLFLVVLAAYANHFHNSFHFDDTHTIVNNAAIRRLRNIPFFFRDARTFGVVPSNQSYRPLVSTLMAIDYRLGHGLDPFWFHLSSFTLFVSLTMLLVFVIYHLQESEAASSAKGWIALAAAGWYALNPANADPVNYIIVSAEIISTLGVVASFAFYLAFPRLRRYSLYVLPAAVAILAKPTAAIFPVLFAVYRLLFPDRDLAGRRPAARERIVDVLPAFLFCGAVLLFVQSMTPRTWTGGAMSAHDYLITQPYVALLYFKTFFSPAGLSADYGLHPFVTTSDPRFWIGCAFVLFIGAAAIVAAAFRKTRLIGFGLLWFLIALLPTSLFPLAEVMNDYRAFPAYVGLVIAVAGAAGLLAARLKGKRNWVKVAATGAVVLFLGANAYATFQRNKVWKTDETLWHDVVLKNPRNERALVACGIALIDKGDFTGALDYLRRAQQLTPPYPGLLINLAISEDATGQGAAAEQHFREALHLAPSLPASYVYYARYLLSHSRPEDAEALLRTAPKFSPTDLTARELPELLKEAESGVAAQAPELYLAQGAQLYREGRYIESVLACRRALDLQPDDAEAWNNIGAAYLKLGSYQEAAAAYEQALRYKPDLESARINLDYARTKLKGSGR